MRQLRDQKVKKWQKTGRSGGRQTWEPLVLSKHSASLHKDGVRWPQDGLSQSSLLLVCKVQSSIQFLICKQNLCPYLLNATSKQFLLVTRTIYRLKSDVKYDNFHSTCNELPLTPVGKPIYWETSSDRDGFCGHLEFQVLLLLTEQDRRRSSCNWGTKIFLSCAVVTHDVHWNSLLTSDDREGVCTSFIWPRVEVVCCHIL